MGSRLTMPHLWREDEPYSFDEYKYDPQFGFNGERKQKRKFHLLLNSHTHH